MTRRSRAWLLVFCVAGLAASVAAAYVHYHVLRDPTYTSACDINATVSCTQVYMSRFGTFAGVPVAVFGAIWFAAALLLIAGAHLGPPVARDNAAGYLFVLSTIGLAVVLYLGYASFFVLKAICVLCLTTYAAVIALFLISGAATTYPMTTLPRRAAQDVRRWSASPLAIAVTIVFLGAAASAVAFFPREGAAPPAAAPRPLTQDQRSELERYMDAAPRVPLIIPAEGAKVLIVKFNDYQCPGCGQSYLQYKPIFAKYEAQYPGAIRLVTKDYPLNPNCNPNVTQMLHPAACDAAVAVRLAKAHNQGEAMEEWLYTHQPSMTPAAVRQAAHDVGQVNDFDAKSASTLELVKGDVGLGKQLHITTTPTFFVNGVKLEGAWKPEYFDQAIAYELRRAGSTK
jgi:vitamin-K-epoxide reductase (warfarin-sensitive)